MLTYYVCKVMFVSELRVALRVVTAHGDEETIASVHNMLIDHDGGVLVCIKGESDPYLGGASQSRVCSHGESNTSLSGSRLANLSDGGQIIIFTGRRIIKGESDPYLGGASQSRVCSHGGSDTPLSGSRLAKVGEIWYVTAGTLELGLQLYASATTSLVGYTDADWAGCPSTRRSTSGYCVFLGDNLLSWSAKRQHTISRSSAEAEYRGVANVVAETAWIRNLLRELHSPLLTATLVYCDNVSAVYMSANPVQHQRTKHIEIDIHFVRDMVKAGHVRVLHVPSRFQYADIFTKGLPSALFEDFRSSLSVRPPPAPTAGAY
ncbi:ribonuclease H-like domain-containing protein [Tanacetum coccineum]